MQKLSLCLLEGDLIGAAPSPLPLAANGRMDPRLWGSLPPEILEMILFTMIPASSKCKFRAVCREWRTLLSSSKAFSGSTSPQLIGNLYTYPGEHLPPCKDDHKNTLREEYYMHRSLATQGRLQLVARDSILDLPFLPEFFSTNAYFLRNQSSDVKLCDSDGGIVVEDGLGCIVIAPTIRDRWQLNTRRSDIYVVNPMNKTWQLLPKCARPVPYIRFEYFAYDSWKVSVVVSRPPQCTFHVLVTGYFLHKGIEQGALLRYSSETCIWEYFKFPRNELLLEYVSGTSTMMSRVERAAPGVGILNLYSTHAPGEALSLDASVPLPCQWSPIPTRAFEDEKPGVFMIKHRGRMYLGVGTRGLHQPWCSIEVWELDPISAKKWQFISAAPRDLLGDCCIVDGTPGPFASFVTKASLICDFLSFGVLVVDEENRNMVDRRVPDGRQWVYFHLPSKTWHNGRTFFCPKVPGAYEEEYQRPLLDNRHFVFEPRLDLFLGR